MQLKVAPVAFFFFAKGSRTCFTRKITISHKPPPLLSASLVVPDELQALPHVLDLITIFLMPETIDAAVYNDLHRCTEIFDPGQLEPWMELLPVAAHHSNGGLLSRGVCWCSC